MLADAPTSPECPTARFSDLSLTLDAFCERDNVFVEPLKGDPVNTVAFAESADLPPLFTDIPLDAMLTSRGFAEGFNEGRQMARKQLYFYGWTAGIALGKELYMLEQTLDSIDRPLLHGNERRKLATLYEHLLAFQLENVEDSERPVTLEQLRDRVNELVLLAGARKRSQLRRQL